MPPDVRRAAAPGANTEGDKQDTDIVSLCMMACSCRHRCALCTPQGRRLLRELFGAPECACLTTCRGHGGIATCSPWCRSPECAT
jgi:hypothetical protein